MIAAVNKHKVSTKMWDLADTQTQWVKKHGPFIFVKKILNPLCVHCHISWSNNIFEDRVILEPVKKTKWLVITPKEQLNFKSNQDKLIANGKKHTNILSSLSKTEWGIALRLVKVLISSTVHGTSNYAVASWLNLPIPESVFEKLTSVENIFETGL